MCVYNSILHQNSARKPFKNIYDAPPVKKYIFGHLKKKKIFSSLILEIDYFLSNHGTNDS